ncbi:MAG TPA: serine hydrolase [Bacteroidia bacterium]|nr:serine hydrolase [Bacteroidia bacterium]
MRKKLLSLGFPLLLLLLAGCTGGRMLVFNFSDIKDYKRFPFHELPASASPFRFAERDAAFIQSKDIRISHKNRREHLDSLLLESNTVAFLIMQHDTLLYERYFRKYEASSLVASFSMAKSYTSALVGCAVADGLIKSIEDKMVDYLPELQGKGLDDVKIRHLLQMTSGIHHAENYYNPFAGVARLYYGRHLPRQLRHLTKDMPAGHYFKYKSINTQLLGEIVARVTGKSLTQYMNEKIWSQIGTEYPATWSIDQKKDGMEKAFSSINATARDFAKFGRLYLHKGNWDGKQLISKEWVEESTKVDAQDGSVWHYQYQWWVPTKNGDFMANGHLGQYIYVNPTKDLVIVRLGKNEGKVDWWQAFVEIATQL